MRVTKRAIRNRHGSKVPTPIFIHAYLHIFSAFDKNDNILIFEEDAQLYVNESHLGVHMARVDLFLKQIRGKFHIYSLGSPCAFCLPLSATRFHQACVGQFFSHACIWSTKARQKIISYCKHNQELLQFKQIDDNPIFKTQFYQYYRVLYYQDFPDTTNSRTWDPTGLGRALLPCLWPINDALQGWGVAVSIALVLLLLIVISGIVSVREYKISKKSNKKQASSPFFHV